MTSGARPKQLCPPDDDTDAGRAIASIAPGRVTITAPILPTVLQQQGAGHAGLAFSIGDSAAVIGALSLMPMDAEVMTVEMKINLDVTRRGRPAGG